MRTPGPNGPWNWMRTWSQATWPRAGGNISREPLAGGSGFPGVSPSLAKRTGLGLLLPLVSWGKSPKRDSKPPRGKFVLWWNFLPCRILACPINLKKNFFLVCVCLSLFKKSGNHGLMEAIFRYRVDREGKGGREMFLLLSRVHWKRESTPSGCLASYEGVWLHDTPKSWMRGSTSWGKSHWLTDRRTVLHRAVEVPLPIHDSKLATCLSHFILPSETSNPFS